MLGWERAARVLVAVVATLTILVSGGCAATINHSYDPSTDFGPLKRYTWAPGSGTYSQTSLVEANVQFVADPLLEQKGFNRTTVTPDFIISVKVENDTIGSSAGYELSMLGLSVYRSDGRTLIWRGTASGSISTDAASRDLRKAVQRILAAFPPPK